MIPMNKVYAIYKPSEGLDLPDEVLVLCGEHTPETSVFVKVIDETDGQCDACRV
jgi:hypothetical protein